MSLSREYLHFKYLGRPFCEVKKKKDFKIKTGDLGFRV
jgi:hypothetical protein